MTDKIYKVNGPAGEKLVFAPNKNAAISYVAGQTYQASMVSKLDLIRLLGQGLKVEHSSPAAEVSAEVSAEASAE
jgi:hypothetical protein